MDKSRARSKLSLILSWTPSDGDFVTDINMLYDADMYVIKSWMSQTQYAKVKHSLFIIEKIFVIM